MNYFRLATLIGSATALFSLFALSACNIIEMIGFGNTIRLLVEQPMNVIPIFYGTLGTLGFNYDFFGNYGPLVIVGLIFTLLIASIPGRS